MTIDSDAQQQTAKLDLASISIKSSILPFWREYPRLWFAQFEIIIGPSKLSDEEKFRHVLSVLQTQDLQQISDVLLNPPASKKYDCLKQRLLAVYEESATKRFQRLLSGMELGDQTPTQLLRKMRGLAGESMSDEGIKILWMNQLPTQIRTVLAVNDNAPLDTMAGMADKMLEHAPGSSVAVVETGSVESRPDALIKRMEDMALEIAELRKKRPAYRRPFSNYRPRAKAGAGRKPGDIDWECYYHYKFGDKATRCEAPCKHRKHQAKSGN